MSVKVAVRCRPFNAREKKHHASCIVEMQDKTTILRDVDSKGKRTFTFDHSFWSFDRSDSHYANQKEVFDSVGSEVMTEALQGYNACIFAYGQTGAGKSYSMMGGAEDERGLIPRLCEQLFDHVNAKSSSTWESKIEVSYMEIYLEKVKDLLTAEDGQHKLKVREHKTTGPYVEGLSTHAVCDFEDVKALMDDGNKMRTVKSTMMNDVSSRSHAIFQIIFKQIQTTQRGKQTVKTERVSKISLVDLAGSERSGQINTGKSDRLKEGNLINQSLSTLGKVISTLADISARKQKTAPTESRKDKKSKKKKLHVPYRESTLTWLLRESLGGNSKTSMLAAISPAAINYEETLSTLRYANQAKRIMNKAVVNEDATATMVRKLNEEISLLRAQLESMKSLGPEALAVQQLAIGAGDDNASSTAAEAADLNANTEVIDGKIRIQVGNNKYMTQKEIAAALEQSERLKDDLSRTWEDKLTTTLKMQRERTSRLAEMGIMMDEEGATPVGVLAPMATPYLVNLHHSPTANECLVYYLQLGVTVVTRLGTEFEPEVVRKNSSASSKRKKKGTKKKRRKSAGSKAEKPFSPLAAPDSTSSASSNRVHQRGSSLAESDDDSSVPDVGDRQHQHHHDHDQDQHPHLGPPHAHATHPDLADVLSKEPSDRESNDDPSTSRVTNSNPAARNADANAEEDDDDDFGELFKDRDSLKGTASDCGSRTSSISDIFPTELPQIVVASPLQKATAAHSDDDDDEDDDDGDDAELVSNGLGSNSDGDEVILEPVRTIQLEGDEIAPEHCEIHCVNVDGTVMVSIDPLDTVSIVVNGEPLRHPIRLRSRDEIYLSPFHVFRFENPFEARDPINDRYADTYSETSSHRGVYQYSHYHHGAPASSIPSVSSSRAPLQQGQNVSFDGTDVQDLLPEDEEDAVDESNASTFTRNSVDDSSHPMSSPLIRFARPSNPGPVDGPELSENAADAILSLEPGRESKLIKQKGPRSIRTSSASSLASPSRGSRCSSPFARNSPHAHRKGEQRQPRPRSTSPLSMVLGRARSPHLRDSSVDRPHSSSSAHQTLRASSPLHHRGQQRSAPRMMSRGAMRHTRTDLFLETGISAADSFDLEGGSSERARRGNQSRLRRNQSSPAMTSPSPSPSQANKDGDVFTSFPTASTLDNAQEGLRKSKAAENVEQKRREKIASLKASAAEVAVYHYDLNDEETIITALVTDMSIDRVAFKLFPAYACYLLIRSCQAKKLHKHAEELFFKMTSLMKMSLFSCERLAERMFWFANCTELALVLRSDPALVEYGAATSQQVLVETTSDAYELIVEMIRARFKDAPVAILSDQAGFPMFSFQYAPNSPFAPNSASKRPASSSLSSVSTSALGSSETQPRGADESTNHKKASPASTSTLATVSEGAAKKVGVESKQPQKQEKWGGFMDRWFRSGTRSESTDVVTAEQAQKDSEAESHQSLEQAEGVREESVFSPLSSSEQEELAGTRPLRLHTMTNVLASLDTLWDLANECNLRPQIVEQVFASSLFYLGATAFNVLMDHRELFSVEHGILIRYNVTRVLDWCRAHGLTNYERHFVHVIEAAQLLQSPKNSLEQLDVICDTCANLNSVQVVSIMRWFSHKHDKDASGRHGRKWAKSKSSSSDSINKSVESVDETLIKCVEARFLAQIDPRHKEDDESTSGRVELHRNARFMLPFRLSGRCHMALGLLNTELVEAVKRAMQTLIATATAAPRKIDDEANDDDDDDDDDDEGVGDRGDTVLVLEDLDASEYGPDTTAGESISTHREELIVHNTTIDASSRSEAGAKNGHAEKSAVPFKSRATHVSTKNLWNILLMPAPVLPGMGSRRRNKRQAGSSRVGGDTPLLRKEHGSLRNQLATPVKNAGAPLHLRPVHSPFDAQQRRSERASIAQEHWRTVSTCASNDRDQADCDEAQNGTIPAHLALQLAKLQHPSFGAPPNAVTESVVGGETSQGDSSGSSDDELDLPALQISFFDSDMTAFAQ